MKVVFAESASVSPLPLVVPAGDQLPLGALHDVAFVDDHVSVARPPERIEDGDTERVAVTCGTLTGATGWLVVTATGFNSEHIEDAGAPFIPSHHQCQTVDVSVALLRVPTAQL